MMQIYTLENICDIKSGGTPSRTDLTNYGGDIPWAKISDIEACNGTIHFTEETISEKGLRAIHNRIFKKGTLLFAMYGSVGKMAFAGQDLSTNQAILGISIKDTTKLFDLYLYYWLFKQKEQFLTQAKGVTQKNLSATFVRNLSIPLPPLEEQKRIAAILDKADTIRRKRKEAIALTEELLRSTFLDMFGDPVTNPKGWDVYQLGDLINIKGGGTPDRNNELYWNGDIPWASVKDFTSLELETTQEFITEKGVKNSATNVIPLNTILIVTRMAVGKVCITKRNIAINQDLKALFCSNLVHPKYLLYFLLAARSSLAKYESGATVKGITIEILKNIKIPLPPSEKQKIFIETEQQINLTIHKAKEAYQESDNFFNSLLQKAFRGEL